MKRRAKIIKSCSECENRWQYSHGTYACTLMNYNKISTPSEGILEYKEIPDWCPLDIVEVNVTKLDEKKEMPMGDIL